MFLGQVLLGGGSFVERFKELLADKRIGDVREVLTFNSLLPIFICFSYSILK